MGEPGGNIGDVIAEGPMGASDATEVSGDDIVGEPMSERDDDGTIDDDTGVGPIGGKEL